MLSKVTPIVLMMTILCVALMTEASVNRKEKKAGGGKRDARNQRVMTGGESDMNVQNEELIQAATFATAELTSRSNGRYRVQHQRITKATSQIVSGLMYRITMDVTVTGGDGKSETTTCTVEVSDQAWMTPRYKLVEYKCDRLIS